MTFRLLSTLVLSSVLAAGAFAIAQSATPRDAPAKAPATAMVASRRLTESQYRNTIADVFGPDIKINGRFEPERRDDGLLAIGSAKLSISAAGFEQYYSMAKSTADQVFDDRRRDRFLTCRPDDPKTADAKCLEPFIRDYGLRLFRRPLSTPEVQARLTAATKGAALAKDHVVAMKLALTSLLMAPEFLFRIEIAEPDPGHRGDLRLDGFTKASRLSYLMWDTAPDPELLRAAGAGELQDKAGLERQVARLTASPRLQTGARAFFTDMLQLDGFETLTKDVSVYPKFSAAFMDSAREQTLRTIVDLLVAQKADYRDIFTSRQTFINRQLASIYQVPYVATADWSRYAIPADTEAAGLVTQATFLTLFSHPGRTSPTRRGVALNEIFLCQPTPTPPANVDFSRVRDSNEGTVRGRLTDHMNNPGCTGCHRLSDPVGLSLERFDSLGQHRLSENGKPIDVSTELMGKSFEGANGLGQVLHDNPRAPACVVRNVYAYGVGRAPEGDGDRAYLKQETDAFARSGYRFPDLLAQVALSDGFFKVERPKLEPVAKIAEARTQLPGAVK